MIGINFLKKEEGYFSNKIEFTRNPVIRKKCILTFYYLLLDSLKYF